MKTYHECRDCKWREECHNDHCKITLCPQCGKDEIVAWPNRPTVEQRTKELFERNKSVLETAEKAVQAAADKMGITFT